MKLSEEYSNNLSIQRYETGCVTITEQDYHENILVSNNTVLLWPIEPDALSAKDFEIILEKKPEVFIFGTGAKRLHIDPELLVPLLSVGIGVEMMDTGAACRTFNLLSAENRNVIAGLII